MSSGTFVRRGFYMNPPSANASADDWFTWSEADEKAARVEKAKFTRQRNRHTANVDTLSAFGVRKVNGVYKQVPAVGFTGSVEGHNIQIEPAIEATQEVDIDTAKQRMNAFTSRSFGKGRSKMRRVKIRKARRAKYRQQLDK